MNKNEYDMELVDFKMSETTTIKILKGSEKTAEVFKELFKDFKEELHQMRVARECPPTRKS